MLDSRAESAIRSSTRLQNVPKKRKLMQEAEECALPRFKTGQVSRCPSCATKMRAPHVADALVCTRCRTQFCLRLESVREHPPMRWRLVLRLLPRTDQRIPTSKQELEGLLCARRDRYLWKAMDVDAGRSSNDHAHKLEPQVRLVET